MSIYGKRFECYNCDCKFYDLNKPVPICPRCNSDQNNAPKKKPLKVSPRLSKSKKLTKVKLSTAINKDDNHFSLDNPLALDGEDDTGSHDLDNNDDEI